MEVEVIDEKMEEAKKHYADLLEQKRKSFATALYIYNNERLSMAEKKGTKLETFEVKGFKILAVNQKLANKYINGMLRRAGVSYAPHKIKEAESK